MSANEGVRKLCGACGAEAGSDAFSHKQWAAKAAKRRCKACVASGAEITGKTSTVPVDAASAATVPDPPLREGQALCDRDGCGAVAKKYCTRCCNVWYCSSACQKMDWKARHKTACTPRPAPNRGAWPKDASQQKWIRERLQPIVNDPSTRERLGTWMFDRRMDEGSIADKPGRVEKGRMLRRQLVLFVDVNEYLVRGRGVRTSALWFSDLPGIRFAAKESRRQRQTGEAASGQLTDQMLTVATAMHLKVKQCFDNMEAIGGCYTDFVVSFTDSHPGYSDGRGGRPDALCTLTFPSACIDRWAKEMQAAGKVG